MEERGRNAGDLDCFFFAFFLREMRIQIDLGRAEFARCEMADDLCAASAGEISFLKFEQFV